MFYDRFEQLCRLKGVSVTKATVEIGLSRTIGTKWKRTGATPNGETLTKIASYFGMPVDVLLGKEKAPTTDGERKTDIDVAKIALFGGDGEVTDEMWEEAIFAAQLIKDRHKRKKERND